MQSIMNGHAWRIPINLCSSTRGPSIFAQTVVLHYVLTQSFIRENIGDGILPCEYENGQNPTHEWQLSSMLPGQGSENAACQTRWVFLMLPLYLSISWHCFPKRASNCCVTACLLSIIPNDWLQFLTAWSCTFLFPQTFFCSPCLHVPQTVRSLLYFTPAAALAFCVFCFRYVSGSTHLCCEYHGFKPWKTFMSPNVPVTDFILPSDVQCGPQTVQMKPPYKL